jgi:hypothetical protein
MSEGSPEKKSIAQRVDLWVRSSPFLYLFLVALIISSTITISQGVGLVVDYVDEHYQWRQVEYSKIASLRAGISAAKVEEVMGSPLFVKVSEDGMFTELTFEGRDYWVQAVHDGADSVVLLAITSCSRSFHPTLKTRVGEVTLNESLFDFEGNHSPIKHRYYGSGATRNSFFYDQYYEGNPGFYKTYFFGINDACPAVANHANELGAVNWTSDAPDSSAIQEFRSNSVINTYAETTYVDNKFAPDGIPQVDDLLRRFQIGADRLLTRTVHPEQERWSYDD